MQLKSQSIEGWQNEKHYSKENNTSQNPIPRREIFKSGQVNKGENQTLVGAIPFCGEYPGSRFEDKFRLVNQIDGISIADGGKMADR